MCITDHPVHGRLHWDRRTYGALRAFLRLHRGAILIADNCQLPDDLAEFVEEWQRKRTDKKGWKNPLLEDVKNDRVVQKALHELDLAALGKKRLPDDYILPEVLAHPLQVFNGRPEAERKALGDTVGGLVHKNTRHLVPRFPYRTDTMVATCLAPAEALERYLKENSELVDTSKLFRAAQYDLALFLRMARGDPLAVFLQVANGSFFPSGDLLQSCNKPVAVPGEWKHSSNEGGPIGLRHGRTWGHLLHALEEKGALIFITLGDKNNVGLPGALKDYLVRVHGDDVLTRTHLPADFLPRDDACADERGVFFYRDMDLPQLAKVVEMFVLEAGADHVRMLKATAPASAREAVEAAFKDLVHAHPALGEAVRRREGPAVRLGAMGLHDPPKLWSLLDLNQSKSVAYNQQLKHILEVLGVACKKRFYYATMAPSDTDPVSIYVQAVSGGPMAGFLCRIRAARYLFQNMFCVRTEAGDEIFSPLAGGCYVACLLRAELPDSSALDFAIPESEMVVQGFAAQGHITFDPTSRPSEALKQKGVFDYHAAYGIDLSKDLLHVVAASLTYEDVGKQFVGGLLARVERKEVAAELVPSLFIAGLNAGLPRARGLWAAGGPLPAVMDALPQRGRSAADLGWSTIEMLGSKDAGTVAEASRQNRVNYEEVELVRDALVSELGGVDNLCDVCDFTCFILALVVVGMIHHSFKSMPMAKKMLAAAALAIKAAPKLAKFIRDMAPFTRGKPPGLYYTGQFQGYMLCPLLKPKAGSAYNRKQNTITDVAGIKASARWFLELFPSCNDAMAALLNAHAYFEACDKAKVKFPRDFGGYMAARSYLAANPASAENLYSVETLGKYGALPRA